jgi:putative DNA-invertase from lambdoid prophage Rac
MSRTFAYCRVSTNEQTTANQMLEISAKFEVAPHRIFEESISGSKPADERPVFKTLLDKMEEGDRLVVVKLDRLGRNAYDVQKTVEELSRRGIEVHCLALAGLDMGTAIGGMLFKIIAAFGEFERDLIIERTKAGLARAKAEGKVLGRPKALTDAEKDEVRAAVKGGASFRSVAKSMSVSHATVMRACGAI